MGDGAPKSNLNFNAKLVIEIVFFCLWALIYFQKSINRTNTAKEFNYLIDKALNLVMLQQKSSFEKMGNQQSSFSAEQIEQYQG